MKSVRTTTFSDALWPSNKRSALLASKISSDGHHVRQKIFDGEH
ncbi:uncharacterized protein G2W53_004109 [Senna tora]|uniref:Uncharacterized protein n=1 Tax=Senna tora TaxID=362788 RepID=A0A835CGB2_9FABA|nr:uncharacterized protein G2W53_004109 [Senna tora]